MDPMAANAWRKFGYHKLGNRSQYTSAESSPANFMRMQCLPSTGINRNSKQRGEIPAAHLTPRGP
jgi:hypothetical protein